MKIIELQSENVKRFKAVRIKPDGCVVQLTGKNSIWRSVIGYEDYYEVSNDGIVRSLRDNFDRPRQKVLSPFIVRGYYQVNLYKEQKQELLAGKHGGIYHENY